MMKVILYMVLPLLLITGCTDDTNEPTDNPVASTGIDGAWQLIKITSSIGKPESSFEKGTIIWQFAQGNQQVVVSNNAATKDYSGMQSGRYSYSILANAQTHCDKVLTIKNNNGIGGCATVSNDTLTVANAYAGHYNFIFVR
ncbi:hypothetical protein [Flavobacterium subsaxonicum]|nr:hypothetical protein [Flavobacterium subsaxonicum]